MCALDSSVSTLSYFHSVMVKLRGFLCVSGGFLAIKCPCNGWKTNIFVSFIPSLNRYSLEVQVKMG